MKERTQLILWGLVTLLFFVGLVGPCKNLKLKFDIQKIMEPKICTGLPKIDGPMVNMTVEPGEKVMFTCQVDHSCMVSSIKWFHLTPDNETETLIKTARTSGDPHVHHIRSVSPSHEGSYRCVAENVLGQSEVVAYLAVNTGVRGPELSWNMFGVVVLGLAMCNIGSRESD